MDYIYWCIFYLDENDTHSHQEVHTRTMWLSSVYRMRPELGSSFTHPGILPSYSPLQKYLISFWFKCQAMV